MQSFEDVDEVFARASVDITRRLGIRYHRLPTNEAPDTLAATVAYYNKHNALGVGNHWHGRRFFGERDNANAFDAWHDWSHVTLNASFDAAGEVEVNKLQQAHLFSWAHNWEGKGISIPALYRASSMLDMHNIGRIRHWKAFGGPPVDARAFAEGWLAALDISDKVPLYHEPRPAILGKED